MKLSELEQALSAHGMQVELVEKLTCKAHQAPPPAVMRAVEVHKESLKAHLRAQRQLQPLPPELQAMLRAAANQGTGITGAVALPSGLVPRFDEYVLAQAASYLASPTAHTLQRLQEAARAWVRTLKD